jgi:transcriptional regulator with XRE-family HTH domain
MSETSRQQTAQYSGDDLRVRRKVANLTARAVAEEMGVWPESLSRWEARQTVSARTAFAVFHAIDRLSCRPTKEGE